MHGERNRLKGVGMESSLKRSYWKIWQKGVLKSHDVNRSVSPKITDKIMPNFNFHCRLLQDTTLIFLLSKKKCRHFHKAKM